VDRFTNVSLFCIANHYIRFNDKVNRELVSVRKSSDIQDANAFVFPKAAEGGGKEVL
jgi:hypothetical protein